MPLSDVLIETLWNVNSHTSSNISICVLRINRNIVECKLNGSETRLNAFPGINRNIVECK